jgi:hypothetical protein
MPQLVREARYFSHLEHGVEIGESISLYLRSEHNYVFLIRGATHTNGLPPHCGSHHLQRCQHWNIQLAVAVAMAEVTYLSLPRLSRMTSRP